MYGSVLYLISTHAPLARCDYSTTVIPVIISNFNSRTSCEVRLHPQHKSRNVRISTHAPLARCDRMSRNICRRKIPISTHAPLARCDAAVTSVPSAGLFQLTHLLRGATNAIRNTPTACWISTHAPLARCDRKRLRRSHLTRYFNSRTSCEVRLDAVSTSAVVSAFQLTHLLRGATQSPFHPALDSNFNSRTSCEVRRCFHLW